MPSNLHRHLLYRMQIDNPTRCYFVGENAVLVHNHLPAVIFSASVAFGEGAVAGGSSGSYFGPVGISVGVLFGGILGIGIGKWCSDSEGRAREDEYLRDLDNLDIDSFRAKYKGSAGSRTNKPEKRPCDPFNPRPGDDCYYVDAPYHHFNSVGNQYEGKSRAPRDGQEALWNSVRVKANKPRRVGISQGEFVVLDYTCHDGNGNCQFHGHVREWDGLDQNMKNALQDKGLVNKSGKILKKW